MLNWVWLGMIALGIGVAVTFDIVDQGTNKYRNGDQLAAEFILTEPFEPDKAGSYQAEMRISVETFNSFYKTEQNESISENVKITVNPEKKNMVLFFKVDESSPGFWRDMAKISGKEDDLTGNVIVNNTESPLRLSGAVVLESINFVKMKNVTNSALDYAGVAVEIALGLIGIMALWLGVMKVAEEAGLIKIIAKGVQPVTRFLFPDVPPDHPAMGAIIPLARLPGRFGLDAASGFLGAPRRLCSS